MMEALAPTEPDAFPKAMTLEEYLELQRQLPHIKFEYLDGMVYEMPGGSIKHENICSNFFAELIKKLGELPCQVYLSGLKLELPEDRGYFYPDLMVMCPPPIHAAIDPILVAEVLSPSTSWYDTSSKKIVYMGIPSLRHLLFIDPQQVFIEHNYRYQADDIWKVECLDDLSRDLYLHSWDMHIPISKLYRFIF
jgi:Uma2 family endonuclease